MGISGTQFFQTSQNGKAMIIFLAQNGHVELVKDALDWLVNQHKKSIKDALKQQGASEAQAEAASKARTDGLFAAANSANDRNVEAVAASVIDAVFQRYYDAGKQRYDAALLWLANELRQKIVD